MKAGYLLLGVLMVSITPAQGQLRSGEHVVINDRVTKDLYVAGGTVIVDAPVSGDLVVTGGTITVNDTIQQDVLIAGADITMQGVVKDDVRGAGGRWFISGRVDGDVLITGGTITINSDAIILGDVIVTGGEIIIDGTVTGMLKLFAGSFVLNGTVQAIEARAENATINGKVDDEAVLSAHTIVIGEKAHFSKNLRYWNKVGRLDAGASIDASDIVLDPSLEMESGKWHYLGFPTLLMVTWYLGMVMVFIVLLQYLFAGTFRRSAETIRDFSLKSLGLGVLLLLGIPISIVVLFLTIVGIPLGLLMLVGYATLLLLGTIIVAILIANWINNTYDHSWSGFRIMMVSFIIFVILKLATLTPGIGPAIMFILICMGFGGLFQNLKWRKSTRTSMSGPTAPH